MEHPVLTEPLTKLTASCLGCHILHRCYEVEKADEFLRAVVEYQSCEAKCYAKKYAKSKKKCKKLKKRLKKAQRGKK